MPGKTPHFSRRLEPIGVGEAASPDPHMPVIPLDNLMHLLPGANGFTLLNFYEYVRQVTSLHFESSHLLLNEIWSEYLFSNINMAEEAKIVRSFFSLLVL